MELAPRLAGTQPDGQAVAHVANRSLAVCVATYRRQELLSRLLESLFVIDVPDGIDVSIRVVDNDADGSGLAFVDALDRPTEIAKTMRCEIERERGIADARNRSLAMGPADLFVFVDDDEVVPVHWLASLLAVLDDTGADVVLGPVSGRVPSEFPDWMRRGRFFDKEVGADGTPLDWRSGRTSNTLVNGSWFVERGKRFDRRYGRSGGSDSALFHHMEKCGARFAACDSARVWEDVEHNRASARWLVLRAYRNGLVFQRITKEALLPARSGWRFAKALALLLTGLPLALVGRHERMVRGLMLAALACGGLVAWIRPAKAENWVEYGERPAAIAPVGEG